MDNCDSKNRKTEKIFIKYLIQIAKGVTNQSVKENQLKELFNDPIYLDKLISKYSNLGYIKRGRDGNQTTIISITEKFINQKNSLLRELLPPYLRWLTFDRSLSLFAVLISLIAVSISWITFKDTQKRTAERMKIEIISSGKIELPVKYYIIDQNTGEFKIYLFLKIFLYNNSNSSTSINSLYIEPNSSSNVLSEIIKVQSSEGNELIPPLLGQFENKTEIMFDITIQISGKDSDILNLLKINNQKETDSFCLNLLKSTILTIKLGNQLKIRRSIGNILVTAPYRE